MDDVVKFIKDGSKPKTALVLKTLDDNKIHLVWATGVDSYPIQIELNVPLDQPDQEGRFYSKIIE